MLSFVFCYICMLLDILKAPVGAIVFVNIQGVFLTGTPLKSMENLEKPRG